MIDRRKRNILITIIVLLSIAFDQISKVWVRNNFESYIETSIVGDIFTLIKVENTGAFLGMGFTCYSFGWYNCLYLLG